VKKITKVGQYLPELSQNKRVSFFYGPQCTVKLDIICFNV